MTTQLYIISPEKFELSEFKKQLKEALSTQKVAVFQLRMKNSSENTITQIAKELIPLCREHDVQFILNDHARIAEQVGADGVHVGEEIDGTYDEARKIMGKNKVVGVSCYGSIDRALDFAEAGADYVAFGAFYPTQTKEPKARPEPDILSWWTTNCTVPCVAIGGIKADNCKPLVEAGADFIAVVSAIWQHPKGPANAVEELWNAIKQR